MARLGARPRDEFEASVQPDGSIVLVPLAVIPARELLVWKDSALREQILAGLAEASAGMARPSADLDRDLDALGDLD
jgi:hypothetical protein